MMIIIININIISASAAAVLKYDTCYLRPRRYLAKRFVLVKQKRTSLQYIALVDDFGLGVPVVPILACF
jgi:hypothetical protein